MSKEDFDERFEDFDYLPFIYDPETDEAVINFDMMLPFQSDLFSQEDIEEVLGSVMGATYRSERSAAEERFRTFSPAINPDGVHHLGSMVADFNRITGLELSLSEEEMRHIVVRARHDAFLEAEKLKGVFKWLDEMAPFDDDEIGWEIEVRESLAAQAMAHTLHDDPEIRQLQIENRTRMDPHVRWHVLRLLDFALSDDNNRATDMPVDYQISETFFDWDDPAGFVPDDPGELF